MLLLQKIRTYVVFRLRKRKVSYKKTIADLPARVIREREKVRTNDITSVYKYFMTLWAMSWWVPLYRLPNVTLIVTVGMYSLEDVVKRGTNDDIATP